MSRQQGPADPPSSRKEIESKDEDEDEKVRNEEIANQWLIDDVVKELIEMELKQREKEVDTEGFEAGSEDWLKLIYGKWSRNGKKRKRMKPIKRAN